MNKQKKILALNIFLFSIFYFLFSPVFASTNITSITPNFYAWNDNVGWIDFYNTGTVNVSSTQLTGYANSSVGFIALDCGTTPNGNVCGQSNFKISKDSSGNLTGWAYNDQIGWIAFDSTTAGSAYPFQVSINLATGDFSGYAWNDNIGWISFNCNNSGAGGCSYPYKVNTIYLTTSTIAYLNSSVYDTGGTSTLNSILWQGSLPNGTLVQFQLASSASSTGPWNYLGTDCSGATYYQPANNVSAQINGACNSNIRYFRYKIILTSDPSQTYTPTVNRISINWSY